MLLGKEKQISYRSNAHIVNRLDLAAAKLGLHEQFDGRKLRTGHVVNSVSLWIGTLSDEELRAFVSPKLRALEIFLSQDGETGGK